MRLTCALSLLILTQVLATPCNNKKSNLKLVCYYSDVSEIDICKCTHIILPLKTNITTIENVKRKFREGKTLLTVDEFNQNLVDILNKTAVDGLDINLRKINDKNDVSDFISTVKSKLNPDLLIAVSIPSKSEVLAKFYNLKDLTKHVEFFILQTAFLASSYNVTFHPSRLSGLWDTQNTDSVVDLVQGLGAPLSKIVISAPVQAFQFTLQNASHNIAGGPALDIQSITRNQLCKKVYSGNNWTLERDQDQTGPYAFLKNEWIAFEDAISIDIKAKYARVRGLAGLALKDLSQDDNENCKFSLLEAAYDGLTRQARAPRSAVLQSLKQEILRPSPRPLDAIQISPYRISRIIDVEGNIHNVRQDTRTEFECSRQGYFMHPRSCGRFYRCVKFDQLSDDFNVFEFDCPDGLIFDTKTEVCVWPGSLSYTTPCTGSSEIAPVPKSRFICPSEEGYYADPENCRWFFACLDHGKSPLSAYEFRCPFGLMFDQSRLVCEWSWRVPSCNNKEVIKYTDYFGSSPLNSYDGLGNLNAVKLANLGSVSSHLIATNEDQSRNLYPSYNQNYFGGIVQPANFRNNFETLSSNLNSGNNQVLANTYYNGPSYDRNNGLNKYFDTLLNGQNYFGSKLLPNSNNLNYQNGATFFKTLAIPNEQAKVISGVSAVQYNSNNPQIFNTLNVIPSDSVSILSPSPVAPVAAAPVPIIRTDENAYKFGVVANVPELQYKVVSNQQSGYNLNNLPYSNGFSSVGNFSQNYNSNFGSFPQSSSLLSKINSLSRNPIYVVNQGIPRVTLEETVNIQPNVFSSKLNSYSVRHPVNYGVQNVGHIVDSNSFKKIISSAPGPASVISNVHIETSNQKVLGGSSPFGFQKVNVLPVNYGVQNVGYSSQFQNLDGSDSFNKVISSAPVPAPVVSNVNLETSNQKVLGGTSPFGFQKINIPPVNYGVQNVGYSSQFQNLGGSDSFNKIISSAPVPAPVVSNVHLETSNQKVLGGTSPFGFQKINIPPVNYGVQNVDYSSQFQNLGGSDSFKKIINSGPLPAPVVSNVLIGNSNQKVLEESSPFGFQNVNVHPVNYGVQNVGYSSQFQNLGGSDSFKKIISSAPVPASVVSNVHIENSNQKVLEEGSPFGFQKVNVLPVNYGVQNVGHFADSDLFKKIISSAPAPASVISNVQIDNGNQKVFDEGPSFGFQKANVISQNEPALQSSYVQINNNGEKLFKSTLRQQPAVVSSYSYSTGLNEKLIQPNKQVQQHQNFVNIGYEGNARKNIGQEYVNQNSQYQNLNNGGYDSIQVGKPATGSSYFFRNVKPQVQQNIDYTTYNRYNAEQFEPRIQPIKIEASTDLNNRSKTFGGFEYRTPTIILEEKRLQPVIIANPTPIIPVANSRKSKIISSYSFQNLNDQGNKQKVAALPVVQPQTTYQTYDNTQHEENTFAGYEYSTPNTNAQFLEISRSTLAPAVQEQGTKFSSSYGSKTLLQPIQSFTPIIPEVRQIEPIVYSTEQSEENNNYNKQQEVQSFTHSSLQVDFNPSRILDQPLEIQNKESLTVSGSDSQKYSERVHQNNDINIKFGIQNIQPIVQSTVTKTYQEDYYNGRDEDDRIFYNLQKAEHGYNYENQQVVFEEKDSKPLIVERFTTTAPNFVDEEDVYNYNIEFSPKRIKPYAVPSVNVQDEYIFDDYLEQKPKVELFQNPFQLDTRKGVENYDIQKTAKSEDRDEGKKITQQFKNFRTSTSAPLDALPITKIYEQTPTPVVKTISNINIEDFIAGREDTRQQSKAKKVGFKGYEYPKPSVEFHEGVVEDYLNRQPVQEEPIVAKKAYLTYDKQNTKLTTNDALFATEKTVYIPSTVQFSTAKPSYSSTIASIVASKPKGDFYYIDNRFRSTSSPLLSPVVISNTANQIKTNVLREQVVVPERTYLPTKTIQEFESEFGSDITISTKPPTTKTYVRINDVHPLLPAKLEAQCTCTSNPVTLRRRLPTTTPSHLDENLYATERQEPIVHQRKTVVLENYSLQPIAIEAKSIEDISSSGPVVVVKKRVRPVTPTPEPISKVETIRIIEEPKIQNNARTFNRYQAGNSRESWSKSFECQRAGLFRHPEHCNKFYSCIWDCNKNKFNLHVFNCPVHLTFDVNMAACNWPSKGPACEGNTLLPNE